MRASMRRDDKQTAPENYQTSFAKLSNKWGLLFMDERIVLPEVLRQKLLDILHLRHAGQTKINAETKIFWWPSMSRDIENEAKSASHV